MSDLMLLSLRWLIAGVRFFIASTIDQPADKPIAGFAAPGDISAIRISRNLASPDFRPGDDNRVITNAAQVERFVGIVNRLQSGWFHPAWDYPYCEWCVSFKVGEEDNCLLWISPGYILGRDVNSSIIYCKLSDDEWTEFEAILATAEIVPPLRFGPPFADVLPMTEALAPPTNATVQVPFPWITALRWVAALYLGSFAVIIVLVGAVERSEKLIWFIRIAYFPVFAIVRLAASRRMG